MKYILRTPTQRFPRDGGFSFVDPRTKMRFDGMMASPDGTARAIIKHRRGNPKVYDPSDSQWFDHAQVVQEILGQKHQTHPHLFVDPAPPTAQASSVPIMQQPAQSNSNACACGANDWEPILCKTCGNGRITGYVCRQCKRKR